jgi:hypothetical protein
VVVEDGLALGEQLEALSRPVEGNQEQLVPPEPDSAVEEPAQIVADPEATAVGFGLTVTVTVGAFVEEQPLALVTVSVYVVVEAGDACGEQLEALSSPVAGSQAQLVPPEPESAVDDPAQIGADPEATAVGFGLTVTVTVGALMDEHPFAPVTLRV